MSAGGVDRLSELPNDILGRILHFAPLKEAASTTALSRRWRSPLWLSSGAVNLETGVVNLETGVVEKPSRRQHHHNAPSRRQHNHNARFFSGSDDLVTAAKRALDATDVPITGLTLIARCPDYDYKDLVGVLLSHQAARHVEKLLLVAKDPYRFLHCDVTLDSLPFERLRIINLTNCSGLLYHREAVLPQLSCLLLSHVCQDLGSLQRVIDAAPALAVIRLESVGIDATDAEAKESTRRCLRCPAATMLVLNNCVWNLKIYMYSPNSYYMKTVDPLEIDAMRLRHFSYKGPLPPYSFTPRPLELEQVDLEFFERGYRVKDPNQDLENFWQFTRNFTSTKEIRLKVDHLEDIAVLSEARQVKLLPTFHRLERLVLHGAHWTKDKTAALATILNLLHCCPVLTALLLNLTAKYEEDSSNKGEVPKRTTRKEILTAAMSGPRYSFQCLQSSLRRVDLLFQLEKKDCLGVKLMKIFAENAMLLEEMRIDGGAEKLCEHMNPRVAKWNSSRTELGTTNFVLLPLNAMAKAPASAPPSQVHVRGAGEMEKRCKKTTACEAKPPPAEEHASSSSKKDKKKGRRKMQANPPHTGEEHASSSQKGKKKGGRKRETR